MISVPICACIDPFDRIGPPPSRGQSGIYTGRAHSALSRSACPFKDGERVLDERRSLLFKTLQVVRFFDHERNVLVYVAYSNRIIEGTPKNSISSVPIMNWPGTQTSTSR